MQTKFSPRHTKLLNGPHSLGEATESIESLGQHKLGQHPSAETSSRIFAQARRPLSLLLQDLRTGLPLLFADCLGLSISMAVAAGCALAIWKSALPVAAVESEFFLRSTFFVLVYALLGMYPGVALNPVVELKSLVLGTLTAGAILFLAADTFGSFFTPETTLVLITTLLAAVLVPVSRFTFRELLGRCSWWGQPALIIGAGPSGMALFNSLKKRAGMGLKPVGIVDSLSIDHATDTEVLPRYLGGLRDAGTIAADNYAHWALIALPDRPNGSLIPTLEHCSSIVHVIVVPGFEDLPSLWNRSCDFGGMMGIHVRERLLCASSRFLKRALDVTAILMSGIFLLPFLAVTYCLIKLISPGPVFYGHPRIGRNGQRFLMWKFRTMVVNADLLLEECLEKDPALREEWNRTQKLKNDPRIIRGIGHFLRKSSLDEIPQLWNVLLGEMSLVGPRPIPTYEFQRYGGTFPACLPLYLKVAPGITGLWQISGRNLTAYEERGDFDAYYVRNWSLWLDLFILGRTVKTVIMREGAF